MFKNIPGPQILLVFDSWFYTKKSCLHTPLSCCMRHSSWQLMTEVISEKTFDERHTRLSKTRLALDKSFFWNGLCYELWRIIMLTYPTVLLYAPQLVTAYDRGHFRKNFWRETHASFENASGSGQKFFLKRPLLRAVAHHHHHHDHRVSFCCS